MKETTFKSLNNRQQRTVILEKRETNKVRPIIASVYGLKKVFRQWLRKVIPGRARWTSSVEETEL